MLRCAITKEITVKHALPLHFVMFKAANQTSGGMAYKLQMKWKPVSDASGTNLVLNPNA